MKKKGMRIESIQDDDDKYVHLTQTNAPSGPKERVVDCRLILWRGTDTSFSISLYFEKPPSIVRWWCVPTKAFNNIISRRENFYAPRGRLFSNTLVVGTFLFVKKN
jgi:hypothetical protein